MKNDKPVYIIAKLSSGEQVMALQVDENPEITTLLYPMEIKMIQMQKGSDKIVTRFSAQPLCQFSDLAEYEIKTKYIMYSLPLSNEMIRHFRSLVVQQDGEAEIMPESEYEIEDEVDFEEMTERKKNNTFH